VTTSAALGAAVVADVERQQASLSRRAITTAALKASRVILVEDLPTAFAVSNAYAPEHLILEIDGARDWLPSVRAAGSAANSARQVR